MIYKDNHVLFLDEPLYELDERGDDSLFLSLSLSYILSVFSLLLFFCFLLSLSLLSHFAPCPKPRVLNEQLFI